MQSPKTKIKAIGTGLVLSFVALSFVSDSFARGTYEDYKWRKVNYYANEDVVSSFNTPADYDPGPAKDSAFAQLFAQTPNYRAMAKYILTGDDLHRDGKFRWQFGPMWYRGRLGANEVKIFVVGQEGAQDENVTNRAFTGSTGTKTQRFLNHLGVESKYLFLNTFVYTINGQLDHGDANFKWMEQGAQRRAESPIVQYRHELFDNMARQNTETLQVVLGVGSGGKASLATWVNARGGDCSPSANLRKCDTSGLKEYFGTKHDIVAIGVPHPGGASPSNGGLAALKNIVRGFTKAAQRVNWKIKNDSKWRRAWFTGLDEVERRTQNTETFGGKFVKAENRKAVEEDLMRRLETEYDYGNAEVPFWDFAFGTNWRMGDKGTTSNRKNRGSSIQVFSADGRYNAKGDRLVYDIPGDYTLGMTTKSGKRIVRGMEYWDLPYEMPKAGSLNWKELLDDGDFRHVNQYDPGPCGGTRSSCTMSGLLQDWPDFSDFGDYAPASHASFGHQGMYRGSLRRAKVLVLADQMSNDDMFSGRAATGLGGQQLQTFLNASGTTEYIVVRTLPVDTLNWESDDVLEVALDRDVSRARDAIVKQVLKQNEIEAVVTLGEVSAEVLSEDDFLSTLLEEEISANNGVDSDDIYDYFVRLDLPSVPGAARDWTRKARRLSFLLDQEPLTDRVYGKWDGENQIYTTAIPRKDLPAHTRWWLGSTGTRAAEAWNEDDGTQNGNYYKVFAPKWVADDYTTPTPLTEDQKKDIRRRMKRAGLAGPGRAGGDLEVASDVKNIFNAGFFNSDSVVFKSVKDEFWGAFQAASEKATQLKAEAREKAQWAKDVAAGKAKEVAEQAVAQTAALAEQARIKGEQALVLSAIAVVEAQKAAETAAEKAKEAAALAKQTAEEKAPIIAQRAKEIVARAEAKARVAAQRAQEAVEAAKAEAKTVAEDAGATAEEVAVQVKAAAEEAQAKADAEVEKAQAALANAKQNAEARAAQLLENAQAVAEQAQVAAEQAKVKAQAAAEQAQAQAGTLVEKAEALKAEADQAAARAKEVASVKAEELLTQAELAAGLAKGAYDEAKEARDQIAEQIKVAVDQIEETIEMQRANAGETWENLKDATLKKWASRKGQFKASKIGKFLGNLQEKAGRSGETKEELAARILDAGTAERTDEQETRKVLPNIGE